MDAETMLERVRFMDEAINKKLNRLAELRMAAEKTTSGTMNGMPCAPGVSDKVGGGVQRLVDLSAEIDSDVDAFVDYKDRMCKILEILPDLQYKILFLYYIKYKNMAEIGKDLNYTPHYIGAMRRTAVNRLQFLLNAEEISP